MTWIEKYFKYLDEKGDVLPTTRGCGACIVLLSKYDPVLHQVEDSTFSSCLTLVCSLNGCSITTAEGVGNSKDGFHPIQERFVGFHASQCGFCIPGMCVSMFSAPVNAEKSNRSEPRPGFSKLTVTEAEKVIASNLCRCTGYRPIADACKSFAADVDMEDLGYNSIWKKGQSDEEKMSRLPAYNRNSSSPKFPEFLKKEIKAGAYLTSKGYHWYSPSSIEKLQSILQKIEANDGTLMKIVVGNTGTGYYKELEHYDNYIDLKHIPELSTIVKDLTGIEIGAAKIADHMEKIASGFVRKSGSVGGNLVMAQRKQFPSDIATILLPVDAIVNTMIGQKLEKLTLEEFLGRPPLDSRAILLSIKIPVWELTKDTSSETDTKFLFETYRAAPRPLGNALPYLNAAFLAEISFCRNFTGAILNTCRFSFGAYASKHPIRVRNVEEFLILSIGLLYEAVKLLETTVIPKYGISHSAYKSSLAVGFLFEFLSPLVNTPDQISGGLCNGDNNSMLKDYNSEIKENNDKNGTKFPTLLSSSKQNIQSGNDYPPVGQPVTKVGASIQASGEAVFVDDIPAPGNCLYGAFVYGTEPLARVKSITFKSESPPVGVTALISVKDIPGKNLGCTSVFGEEPLYADEFAQFAGDRVAFVVADTQKHADLAANLAVIDYDKENISPPIFSVEEAVERGSFFQVPFFNPEQVGDFSEGMAEVDCQILSAEIKLGSQYYFYMETQTALAVPDEDNSMMVYNSTQCPQIAQETIAQCLGLPANNIRVITRRLGGGFGGKAIREVSVATACAVAAYKLQRPVRVYVNRKTDMIMAGVRHPMKITYSVGFKDNGKITALKLDILIDAGIFPDVSIVMPGAVVGSLKKFYWDALSFDIKLCKTNLPSRSAMRAPVEVQAAFIAEAIIEHIASTLSIEVDTVRSINLHTYNSLGFFFKSAAVEPSEYTLPAVWDKLATSSSFNQRTEMIQEFNRSNKWRKRGISRVSTKVKQVAAYGLGLIKRGGTEELLEKVRVIQSDTLSLIQGGFPGGSTTSESSCEAVRLCCNVLVERLTALKERLMEQMGTLEWETLILQAYEISVNLSASTLFIPESASMQYLNYGAAVEVNLLSGETTILRSDIIYDCGQSLNPAVDLGQIGGAYVQGIGFFMFEEYPTNSNGLVTANGAWIHCATRAAIVEAMRQLGSWNSVDDSNSTVPVGGSSRDAGFERAVGA
ncbi:Indole-3-acetaldehyde oxidase [Hibiscus syriacus]|uniref:indole-3-acetaldehyde oxidase n=1 Tax=Hibiscus syriacus TaxID=106335 RepID=A0A6A3D6C9_HIBSY|nr:Indole-3-acetaldehyde oxidase [Hibiscus syriacus]